MVSTMLLCELNTTHLILKMFKPGHRTHSSRVMLIEHLLMYLNNVLHRLEQSIAAANITAHCSQIVLGR